MFASSNNNSTFDYIFLFFITLVTLIISIWCAYLYGRSQTLGHFMKNQQNIFQYYLFPNDWPSRRHLTHLMQKAKALTGMGPVATCSPTFAARSFQLAQVVICNVHNWLLNIFASDQHILPHPSYIAFATLAAYTQYTQHRNIIAIFRIHNRV